MRESSKSWPPDRLWCEWIVAPYNHLFKDQCHEAVLPASTLIPHRLHLADMSWWPGYGHESEEYQNARFGAHGWPPLQGYPLGNFGHRRNVPKEMPFTEYDPYHKAWYQGDRKLPNFKPKKFWTRPHDGKRPGAWGRLKDGLGGEGADVFVTTSGDKRTFHKDRPQRWQWTGNKLSWDEIMEKRWFDKDHRDQDEMQVRNAPWTRAERSAYPTYNFRSREYEYPNSSWLNPNRFWQNANWPPNVRHSSDNPLNAQDVFGNWRSRVPWNAGWWAGGRPAWPE